MRDYSKCTNITVIGKYVYGFCVSISTQSSVELPGQSSWDSVKKIEMYEGPMDYYLSKCTTAAAYEVDSPNRSTVVLLVPR